MCSVVKSVVCTLHYAASVAHTDIREFCHELKKTSATVLYSKLSVSLVTNVAAFARQSCVRDDAHMLSALQHYFAQVVIYRAGTVVSPDIMRCKSPAWKSPMTG